MEFIMHSPGWVHKEESQLYQMLFDFTKSNLEVVDGSQELLGSSATYPRLLIMTSIFAIR